MPGIRIPARLGGHEAAGRRGVLGGEPGLAAADHHRIRLPGHDAVATASPANLSRHASAT